MRLQAIEAITSIISPSLDSQVLTLRDSEWPVQSLVPFNFLLRVFGMFIMLWGKNQFCLVFEPQDQLDEQILRQVTADVIL